jgi:hypothetical protein
MKSSIITSLLIIACVAASGCSSRPRNFAATLSAPASDEATYQRDFAACDALARKGYKSNFKAAALSTAGGTAIGVAAGFGAAGIAAASVGTASGGLGAAISAAAVPGAVGAAALFVIAAPVGFGISRAIRSGREKRLKRALTSCMGEYGYTVSDWTVVKKRKKALPLQEAGQP